MSGALVRCTSGRVAALPTFVILVLLAVPLDGVTSGSVSAVAPPTTVDAAPPAGSNPSDLDADHLDDGLERTLEAKPASSMVDVTVRVSDTPEVVARAIDALGPSVTVDPVEGTDLIAVRAPAGEVADIGALADVAQVEADAVVRVDPPVRSQPERVSPYGAISGPTLGAPAAGSSGSEFWQTVTDMAPGVADLRDQYDLTGDGDGAPYDWSTSDVTIAVIDTGINDLGVPHKGQVLQHVNFAAQDPSCPTLVDGEWDQYDHGTHVASIAAAMQRNMMGVAPGAALLDLKVFDCRGEAYASDIDAALGWVMDHYLEFNIRVVNMSIGGGTYTNGTSSTERLMNRLQALGIATVVSAGNNGADISPTVGSPAGAEFATTVGAGNWGFEGTWLAGFSSRGPTADGRIGVDLVAPGVGVYATSSKGAEVLSGTSMAAPFVAGLYALMLAANPALAPAGEACAADNPSVDCLDGVIDTTMSDPLNQIVRSTAGDVFEPGVDVVSGAGYLDATASLRTALGLRSSASVRTFGGHAALARGERALISITASDHPAGVTLVADERVPWMSRPVLTWLDEQGDEVTAPSNTLGSAFGLVFYIRQFTAWLPAGSGQRWLEITAVDPVTFDIGVVADAAGLLYSGFSFEQLSSPIEGGAAGAVRISADASIASEMAFHVKSDGQLVPGATLTMGPAAGAGSVDIDVSAVDDGLPEGRHSGMLMLVPDDPSMPLLRTSVFVDDNDPGTPVNERVLFDPTGNGGIAAARHFTTERVVSAFVAGDGSVLASLDDATAAGVPAPFYAAPDGAFSALPLGEAEACQVDSYGLSADGRTALLGVWPGCTANLFPESVMRYAVFTQDTITGSRVRVSGADSASTNVASAYGTNPRAILSADGGVVSFVEPTNEDAQAANGAPLTAGLFVRVGGDPVRRLGTVGVVVDAPIYVDSTNVIVATRSASLLPGGVTSGVVRISLIDGTTTFLSMTTDGVAVVSVSESAISRNGTHLVYGDGATDHWYRLDLITGLVDDVSSALPWPLVDVLAVDNAGDQLTVKQRATYSNAISGMVAPQGSVLVSVSTGQQWLAGEAPWGPAYIGKRGLWSLIDSSDGASRARFGDLGMPGNGDADAQFDVVRNVSPVPVAAQVPHVTNLRAVSNNGGSVTVSWDPVQGVDHYWLLQKDRSGGVDYVDRGTSTSVTLPFAQAVTSLVSVIPQAGSLVGVSAEAYFTPVPDPPTALAVHRSACRLSVETGWDGQMRTAIEYQVSVDDRPWVAAASTGPWEAQNIFNGEFGHTYHYRLRGVNDQQYGAWSEATVEVSVMDPTCIPQSLNVNRSGNGSVISDVGGINCGVTCSATFSYGTVMVLTASPATGSTFAGWSGACTGTGTCTLEMTARRSVTATFSLTTGLLSVFRSGSGSGSVTSDVGGVNCGATCSATYDYGTSVVLTASPTTGSTFTGWSGACIGTGTCALTMTEATSVTATFTAIPFQSFDQPVRLFDTRGGQRGALEGAADEATAFVPGEVRRYEPGTGADIPSGATLAVNVAAVGPQAAGYLQLYPCDSIGTVPPSASFLNYSPGTTVANNGTVRVDASGGVCVRSSQGVNVIVDTTGYMPSASFVPLDSPVRLVDSRPGQLGALEQPGGWIGIDFGAQLPPGIPVRFRVTDTAGIPAQVAALAVNIVAVNPAGGGYITIYPCANSGTPPPPSSTINYRTGGTIANGAVIAPSEDGGICVLSSQRTHVILDTTGYLVNSTFAALSTPVRLVDSRAGQLGALEQPGGSIGADLSVPLLPFVPSRFVVTNTSGIPGGIAALAMNIVAVNPAGGGYITVYPCVDANTSPPSSSTINYRPGSTIANGAIVNPSPDGGICVLSSKSTNVIIDTTGFFQN